MTDYTDLKRRLEEGRTTGSNLRWTVTDIHRDAAVAIAALEAQVARKDAAIRRALDEAVADDMDGWYAGLRAALTAN